MDFQSELRVYQPLAAFDDDVQAAFQHARHTPRQEVEAESTRRTWSRLLRDVTDPFPHSADLVRVLEVRMPSGPDVGTEAGAEAGVDGLSAFFCPDEMALRCELAATQLAESMRPQTFALLVPEAARQANLERLAQRLAGQVPDELAQVHTRTAVWGIPAAWFVLVHEDDAVHLDFDEMGTTGETPAGSAAPGPENHFENRPPRSARMTVPLTLALERARRAAVVLSLRAPEMDLLSDLTVLVQWLESFHPGSMVELDYGGLTRLVWPDESPYDVRTALDSIAEGDAETATVANHRMVRRWLAVRQLGRAS